MAVLRPPMSCTFRSLTGHRTQCIFMAPRPALAQQFCIPCGRRLQMDGGIPHVSHDDMPAAFAACAGGRELPRAPVFALGLEFDMRVGGVTHAETRADVDKTVRALKEKLGDAVCITGRIAAPFSSLALVYGMKPVLTGICEGDSESGRSEGTAAG